MKRGFMDLAVTIIGNYQGLTAAEVAREALSCGAPSDAKNKEQSFATTLNKQVQTGLETRIRRERVKGVYRYFPTSTPPTSSNSSEEIVVQFSLPSQELKDVDNLIAVSRFDNRSDAIKWLVLEGIKSNRTYLDKVTNTNNEIERLKKEIVEV